MRKRIKIIFYLGLLLVLSSCKTKICEEHILYEILEQEATCFNKGYITIKCKNCDYAVQKEIEKLEHSIVIDEKVEPTCEKAGLTEGSHCAVCNKVIVRQEGIPLKNHVYVGASCKRPQHCINCNKEVGIKLEHQYDNGICVNCGEEEVVELFLFSLSEDGTYYSIRKLLNQAVTQLTLPSEYKDLPVKMVEKHSIIDVPGLKEVTIPSSIEIIEDEAFVNLPTLKTVNLSNGLLKIGYSAFVEIPSLENVYFNGTIENWLNINFVDKTSNPMLYAQNFYLKNELLEEIVIPQSIEKLKYQLYSFKQIKKLVIPETINLIEKGALEGCVNIEYLELPYLGKTLDIEKEKNIRYIFNLDKYEDSYMQNEIYGKYALKEVVLTNATQIDEGAFRYLMNIEKVTLPDSLTIIPEYCFYNSMVKEVILPKKLESIGEYAFFNCYNMAKIEFSDSVVEISNNAFEGCKLENIILPNQLKKIGDYAFAGNKIKEIDLPNSLVNMGSYIFSSCYYLKEVFLPNNIETIKEGMFAYCMELEKIEFPSSLTKIEKNSFISNSSLLTLYLPSSVKVVEDLAFDHSNQLVIYLEHSSIPKSFGEKWNDSSLEYGSLTTSDITYYLNINEENFIEDENFHYIIVDNYAICTKLINKELTTITIPNAINKNNIDYKILKIGDFCFYNGSQNYHFLRDVVVPTLVNEIGAYAFFGLKIEKLILPRYLDKLGKYSFSECEQLKEVSIRKWGFVGNITILEEGTFFGTYIQTLLLPDTITTFEEKSMEGVGNYLINFNLPSNLENSNNPGLEYFNNNENLNEYNNGLYLGTNDNPYHTLIKLIDTEIEELILHEDTKIIAKYAIFDCNNLQTVILPEGLLCIDTESFWDNDNLKEIIIPETVKYINEIAFERCNNLIIKTNNASKPEKWHEKFNGISKVIYNIENE